MQLPIVEVVPLVKSHSKAFGSRFLSEAPWLASAVNARRISYLLDQSETMRRSAVESVLIVDDTVCEQVGTLFEHIDMSLSYLPNWSKGDALIAADGVIVLFW